MVIWLSQSTDEKGEVPKHLVISLSILSAAKLKIFQKPVAVDAEGGDKEHYGKLREFHPSSPAGLSTLLLQVRFFFFFICKFRYEKKTINYTLFTKKNGDWFYLITH